MVNSYHCIDVIGPKSNGIQQSAWRYHYGLGYKHGAIGINTNNMLSISLEQKQAYAAGHYAGIKEWRMRNLLVKS